MTKLYPHPEFIDAAIGWRRHLHRHPELAYREFDTSAYVLERLREAGYEPQFGIGGTGVVALLPGERPGPTIALRADMDALPLTECAQREHRSTRNGVMHACGHDGHTAILLGAAGALATRRDFAGTVAFVFQPAEEGEAGARAMLEDPRWPGFGIERIYGLHNWPDLPLGEFAILEGPCMAASDIWDIRLRGRGGHAGWPHRTQDTAGAVAALTAALSGLTRRIAAPTDPAVVTVTQIHAGTAYNVIPAEAHIAGTVRTLQPDTQARIREAMQEVAQSVAALYGMEAELDYQPQYPVTFNHAAEVADLRRAASRVDGLRESDRPPTPSMGAEDFSFFTQRLPGAYLWLGIRDAEHEASLHSCAYDFNDAAIAHGIELWVALVEDLLGGK